ncbi:DUF6055 domain-containing protein [Clostridium felsineum]|uniref:DUF6055 domain-containing protein n=1 Tax=Clostridium felsineum TaxID=36839 RepID=UPI0009C5E25A|nr:DUF6055 domain-containing protein [Clostridium felsineum]URZ18756.1 hypothetical protein CLFE_048440 [Clostridium felsineum DSM 794]
MKGKTQEKSKRSLPKIGACTLALTVGFSNISFMTQTAFAKSLKTNTKTAVSKKKPVKPTNPQSSNYVARGVHNDANVISSANAHTYESEHFQFLWGNGGNSSKVTQAFLEGNAKILESCWNVYINNLKMIEPAHSVNDSSKNDKNYKVNVVILGTGLPQYESGWAFSGLDSEGFPYLMCDVGAMDPSPTVGLTVPHEFGHVINFAQGGNSWGGNDYLSPWYEAIGDWFREEYVTSDLYKQETGVGDTTFLSPLFLRSTQLTLVNGRCYYEGWPIFTYLEENPDNLPGYGAGFMAKLLKSGDANNPNETLYQLIQRVNPSVPISVTMSHFASRMATFDMKNKARYKKSFNDMLANGTLYWQQFYVTPNKVNDNTYAVPQERAPQAYGYNIVPLKADFSGNASTTTVNVQLNNTTAAGQSNLTAYIVAEDANGNTRYSSSFGTGQSMQMSVSKGDKVYLSVSATPSLEVESKTQIGLPSFQERFSEKNMAYEEKPQYPYQITLQNAEPQNRTADVNSNVSGHVQQNGGGFVADSANVDSSVYVAKNAKVLDSAQVTGNARIEGSAVISGNANISGSADIKDNAWIKGDARISGNAVVDGYAVVDGEAQVRDSAHIGDRAIVAENAQVFGNASVIESAQVQGFNYVSDHAIVKGLSLLLGGSYDGSHSNIKGTAVTYGDFFNDYNYTITNGDFSGYECLNNSIESYHDGYAVSDGKGGYTSAKHAFDGGDTPTPTPTPTPVKSSNIALSATASASVNSPEDLGGVTKLNDGYDPTSSGDESHGLWHNWHGDQAGQAWVEYDWNTAKTLTGMDAYYFKDGNGNFAPQTVSIQVKDSKGNWVSVSGNGLGVDLNKYNTTTFNPVKTTAIRMYITPKTLGCGVIEWKVYGY